MLFCEKAVEEFTEAHNVQASIMVPSWVANSRRTVPLWIFRRHMRIFRRGDLY